MIPLNTQYCINPVVYKEEKIYQVQIDADKIVKVFNGEKWKVTEDEDLIYLIIVRLLSKDSQREIPFAEAV